MVLRLFDCSVLLFAPLADLSTGATPTRLFFDGSDTLLEGDSRSQRRRKF
jgi:hypothetical protein